LRSLSVFVVVDSFHVAFTSVIAATCFVAPYKRSIGMVLEMILRRSGLVATLILMVASVATKPKA